MRRPAAPTLHDLQHTVHNGRGSKVKGWFASHSESSTRRPRMAAQAGFAFCAAACLSAACLSATANAQSPFLNIAQTRNALICNPLPGFVMLLDDDRRVAMVANIPGTNEPPDTISELACAMSARGPLVVGLEWRTDLQPWLDAFMASDGGDEAVAALVNILDPAPPADAPSLADFAMLERLRLLAHAGRDVRVIAWLIPELEEMPPPIEPIPSETDLSFDFTDPDEDLSVPPPGEENSELDIWRNNLREPESLEEAREAFMADMLQVVSGPKGRILVLASRERVKQATIRHRDGPPYPSFAMMYPPRTALSLDLLHNTSAPSACAGVDCRFEPVNGDAGGDLRMVARFPTLTDGFNGVVMVGRLTASPAATPATPSIAYQRIFDDAAPQAAEPASAASDPEAEPETEPETDSASLVDQDEATLLADAGRP